MSARIAKSKGLDNQRAELLEKLAFGNGRMVARIQRELREVNEKIKARNIARESRRQYEDMLRRHRDEELRRYSDEVAQLRADIEASSQSNDELAGQLVEERRAYKETTGHFRQRLSRLESRVQELERRSAPQQRGRGDGAISTDQRNRWDDVPGSVLRPVRAPAREPRRRWLRDPPALHGPRHRRRRVPDRVGTG